MGSHFLLQEIFLTQGLNLHFLNWKADSLLLSHQGRRRTSYKKTLLSTASLERLSKVWWWYVSQCPEGEGILPAELSTRSFSLALNRRDEPKMDHMLRCGPLPDPRNWLSVNEYCSL